MANIYLDNAATTPVDKKVIKAMLPYFSERYGNASSQHLKGQEAKRVLEESRHVIARSIAARDDEIIFLKNMESLPLKLPYQLVLLQRCLNKFVSF